MIPILMHQMRISTTSVSSVVLGPKKLEIRKSLWKLHVYEPKKNKYYAMKFNQIRRRIELCIREINFRDVNEYSNIRIFVRWVDIRI
jgi:hypothetical protein